MRARFVTALVCSLAAFVLVGSEPVRAADAVTVIRAGTLIDGVSARARTNQVIVVRGQPRSRASATTARSRCRPGAKVIDLSRQRCCPG